MSKYAKRWVGSVYSDSVGYTLIELLLAVLILSVLVSLAVSGYSAVVSRVAREDIKVELVSKSAHLSQLALFSPGGRLIKKEVEALDLLVVDEAVDYQIELDLLGDGMVYWLIARPKPGGRMVGDGALSLTHSGKGCWYANNDQPQIRQPCLNEKDEAW